jgi:hypothetical protein
VNRDIPHKRTSEEKVYDIRCSSDLRSGETISEVTSVLADQAFGTGIDPDSVVTNGAPAEYLYGELEPVGTVIQFKITGGTIPSGRRDETLRVDNVLITIRAKYVTSLGNKLEATVQLLLVDDLP